MNFHDNTCYNNGIAQVLWSSQFRVVHSELGAYITEHAHDDTAKHNIFIAKTSTQLVTEISTKHDDVNIFFNSLDSNYYARPIDDNVTFFIQLNSFSSFLHYNMAQWKAYISVKDYHSKKSPKSITTVNDLRLEYNATTANKTILLDGSYIDVKNVLYSGTVTLAPYTSVVLIRHEGGTNRSPTAKAGANQSITLPANNVNLTGSGTDEDGTVVSFKWAKISGPSTGTIRSINSASTSVTELAQGVYNYELKVTDNTGATDLDTVEISVTAANIKPTTNAGTDQSIKLPVNNVNLTGKGTDVDGTVESYTWSKISGPASGTITDATSASSSIKGLSQGIYQYELKVTDNDGAAGLDTVQIAVYAAVNIPPTAKAGANQSIKLPANKVNLSGEGTDVDGTVESYTWTKISGPSSGRITSANSASSSINEMSQGVYQYELKVSDNKGAAGWDTVQITVYAAANIPPTAKAGADQTIVLPANNVSFSGSGTDVDGTVVRYKWAQISGPSSDNITDANSASTTLTSLVQGVYKFQFEVTDNAGLTGLDTIIVTVIIAEIEEERTLLPAVNPANTVNGLDYKYYEGRSGWRFLPDFSNLTPVKTGTSADFDLSLANRAIAFSFNFTGYINVPSDGQYTFYSTSDDGSNLYIDNVPVVKNDGLHSAREKSGTIGLEKGKHAISVAYFQQGGGHVLAVNYEGPGFSKQVVPESALYRISTLSSRNEISMDLPGVNQTIIPSTQVSVKAYPNPFVNYIEVNVTSGIAGKYKLVLVDAMGRIVWTTTGMKKAGAFQQSVSTSSLGSGNYFLKLIQNNTTSVIKLLK